MLMAIQCCCECSYLQIVSFNYNTRNNLIKSNLFCAFFITGLTHFYIRIITYFGSRGYHVKISYT